MDQNQEKATAASNTAMITNFAEVRRQLWILIAVVKQVAHTMPAKERDYLLRTAIEAEQKLT